MALYYEYERLDREQLFYFILFYFLKFSLWLWLLRENGPCDGILCTVVTVIRWWPNGWYASVNLDGLQDNFDLMFYNQWF